MALTDLLGNKFTRIVGTLAALAVPAGLACEADEPSTTNNYYGNEGNGSSSGGSGNTSTSSTLDQDCFNLYQTGKNCVLPDPDDEGGEPPYEDFLWGCKKCNWPQYTTFVSCIQQHCKSIYENDVPSICGHIPDPENNCL